MKRNALVLTVVMILLVFSPAVKAENPHTVIVHAADSFLSQPPYQVACYVSNGALWRNATVHRIRVVSTNLQTGLSDIHEERLSKENRLRDSGWVKNFPAGLGEVWLMEVSLFRGGSDKPIFESSQQVVADCEGIPWWQNGF